MAWIPSTGTSLSSFSKIPLCRVEDDFNVRALCDSVPDCELHLPEFAEVRKEEVREGWPAESGKKEGSPDDVPPCSSQLPYLYQRVLFYPHPPPRGALELGPPYAVVVPWSERSRSAVHGQCELPSLSATSAFMLQRGRGESIEDKEKRRSRR